MFEWYKNLTEAPKVALTGAIIGAFVTLVIAFLTILAKDYYIPILAERRASKRLKSGAFKKYAYPIILSSISLLYRLDEIFNQREMYLQENAPRTPFNEYKYISTVYRLCALMGWMRASNIEYSNIEVRNTKEYRRVRDAVTEVEKSLADGQHVEEKVLIKLCEIAGLDISSLSLQFKKSFGAKIEHLIVSFCFDNGARSAYTLAPEHKNGLVKHVIQEMCTILQVPQKPHDFFTSDLINDCVQNMDWKQGLIYRDWQSAIGDLMIKSHSGSDRKYEVLGYKEFEELYFSTDQSQKKWIERSEKLFKNLNLNETPTFDNRPEQLKRIFISTYQFLSTYSKLVNSDVKIANDTLFKFLATYQNLVNANPTIALNEKNNFIQFFQKRLAFFRRN